MFELMPEEMPRLLECIDTISKNVVQEPDGLRAKWTNPLLSVNQWIRLATIIQTQLKQHAGKLKTARKFSEQLFDGYLGIFSAHCVQVFAQDSESQKFKALATLFFGFDPDDWKD